MSLSEFAKILGIKRGIAEDALHSERVARLVLSRRTMLIGTAVATAALCTSRLFSQGGLGLPILYILAQENREVEGATLLVGDSVTMTVNPTYPNGALVPLEEKWALLKRHQAKYGGVFIEPPPPRELAPEERAEFSKKLDESMDVEGEDYYTEGGEDLGEEDTERCLNCALPGYDSPFLPDREDCVACKGTGYCPASLNDNPPKQYKTAKRPHDES
jgi:hypothetical protein